MTIAENIAKIRENMAAAAREAGRDPKEILLVGASNLLPLPGLDGAHIAACLLHFGRK